MTRLKDLLALGIIIAALTLLAAGVPGLVVVLMAKAV